MGKCARSERVGDLLGLTEVARMSVPCVEYTIDSVIKQARGEV